MTDTSIMFYWPNLLRALGTAEALIATLVLCWYIPPVISGFRQRPVPRATFLMAGIVSAWVGTFLFYVISSVLYWAVGAVPTPVASILSFRWRSPGIDATLEAARLSWLLFWLSGGSIHIAAAQRAHLGVGRTYLVCIGTILAATILMTILI
jgi:hypothetical protein